jgi:hypothetical protein
MCRSWRLRVYGGWRGEYGSALAYVAAEIEVESETGAGTGSGGVEGAADGRRDDVVAEHVYFDVEPSLSWGSLDDASAAPGPVSCWVSY